jgi:hypothetical protein
MIQVSAGAESVRAGMSRRGVLQLGTLTLAGLAGVNITNPRITKAGPNSGQSSVILLWMAGGPSHIDMYDRKPDAPVEIRGPFTSIDTNLPGLQVCELMPGHAAIADRLTVIRSLHHTLPDHDDASHWVQTGYPLPQARQRGQQQPCQGAVVAKLLGATKPMFQVTSAFPKIIVRIWDFIRPPHISAAVSMR